MSVNAHIFQLIVHALGKIIINIYTGCAQGLCNEVECVLNSARTLICTCLYGGLPPPPNLPPTLTKRIRAPSGLGKNKISQKNKGRRSGGGIPPPP